MQKIWHASVPSLVAKNACPAAYQGSSGSMFDMFGRGQTSSQEIGGIPLWGGGQRDSRGRGGGAEGSGGGFKGVRRGGGNLPHGGLLP